MQKKEQGVNRSLAEEVTDILRNRILQGEYEIGEKLTESKIASELKVSRTPIRDAFRELEKEHLVEYIPNKGCFARGFSKEDLEDICAVRDAIEEVAICRVVRNIDDDTIEDLRQQLEKMWFYTQQRDYEKMLTANREFHRTIFRKTGSRFIIRTMRTYQEYVHAARRKTLKHGEDLEQIYREHENAFRALEARDEAAAVQAIRDHLEGSASRAMRNWEDEPSEEGDRNS